MWNEATIGRLIDTQTGVIRGQDSVALKRKGERRVKLVPEILLKQSKDRYLVS